MERAALRVPCQCARCSKAPRGFILQTRQNKARHERKYQYPNQPQHPARVSDIHEELAHQPAPEIAQAVTPVNEWTMHMDLGHDGSSSDDDNEELVSNYDGNDSTPHPRTPTLLEPINIPLDNDPEVFRPVVPPLDPDPGLETGGDEQRAVGIPAMKEKSYIRMAYLQAVMGNVFGKLTWKDATQQLTNTLDILAVAGRLPVHPRPVRTLQSARRRLGINPDVYIIQYAICPLCWKHHTPSEMNALESDVCTTRGCKGIIFTTKDGKCTPSLINPQVSIIGSLRRMFMRPGFAKMVAKKPEHQPGRNDDDNYIMRDLPDAEMWYRSTIGTVREVGDQGTVCDVPDNGAAFPQKLFSRLYGLQLSLNTDW